jgi:hypothetical protein
MSRQHDNDNGDNVHRLHLADVPHVSELDVTSLPTAHHFKIMRCDDRSHAHVVLFYEDNTPFAQLTLGRVQCDALDRECDKVFAGNEVH